MTPIQEIFQNLYGDELNRNNDRRLEISTDLVIFISCIPLLSAFKILTGNLAGRRPVGGRTILNIS